MFSKIKYSTVSLLPNFKSLTCLLTCDCFALNLQTSNPVYIKMDGDTPGITTSFKLMADGMVINSTDNVMKAIACWISSFYVFNFFYPSSISKSLCFIQRVILNIYDGVPVPRFIISLTNKLANFSQQCKWLQYTCACPYTLAQPSWCDILSEDSNKSVLLFLLSKG